MDGKLRTRIAWDSEFSNQMNSDELNSKWNKYQKSWDGVDALSQVCLAPLDAHLWMCTHLLLMRTCLAPLHSSVLRVLPSLASTCQGISETETNSTHPWHGFICYVWEYDKQESRIHAKDYRMYIHENANCKPANKRLYWLMPPVNLTADDFADRPFIGPLAATDATVSPMRLGGLIVDKWHTECPHTTSVTPLEAVLSYNGTLYLHDRRLQMVENTLEQPSNESAAQQGSHASCPNVARTFLNKESCVRTAACSPVRYTSAMFSLSESVVRMFYEKVAMPVFVIRGLRTSTGGVPDVPSPCAHSASKPILHRWKRLDGGCTPTALDNETANTLVRSIEEATDEANPMLRDVLRPSDATSCTDVADGVSAVGAIVVDTNGTCWQHIHPHEYNVYSFAYWSEIHPGNLDLKEDVISRPGLRGSVYLNWPVEGVGRATYHAMTRWSANLKKHTYIGRLYDEVDYATLPADVQSPIIAIELGAGLTQTPQDGFEACGSPGEVASDPYQDHQYHFYLHDKDKTEKSRILNFYTRSSKSIAVYNVQLSAPDQLRQRVAWAMSQIWVASNSGLNFADENEVFHTYFDIFVRHAFGNVLDVLREVSASPYMGDFLTFRNAKAYYFAGNAPDENYARELMQLFSIGLWELHPDGTYVLDGNGEAIPTYETQNIMDFARVWTGWERRPLRGNIETKNGNASPNKIDPMEIRPRWRDPFPKADLYGGHLGDAYPLCMDVPHRQFLRKGALFRYLGGGKKARKTTAFDTPTGWLSNKRGWKWRGPYSSLKLSSAPYLLVNNTKLSTIIERTWDQQSCDTDGCFYTDLTGGEYDDLNLIEEVAQPLPYWTYTQVRGKYFRAWGSYNLDRTAVTLSESNSSLHATLCSRSPSGRCTFPSEVVLQDELPCFDMECRVTMLRLLKLHEYNSDRQVIETAYYEYVAPPCVHLTFFRDGRHIQHGTNNKESSAWQQICSDPKATIGYGASCCKQPSGNA